MKLPVAYTIGCREASLDKDALLRNGLVEMDGEQPKARKRPALDSAYTATTGQGQGLFTWNTPGPEGPDEALVVISDDTLIYGSSITTLTKSLRFVQQPTDDGIGEVLTPAITVEAISASGSRVTSFTSAIVVTLSTNPTGATLGGDTNNNASSGLATFNDLELNRSGSGFRLTASSSGLRSAVSESFNIPTTLVFTQQPSSGQPDETLDPIEVTSQDEDGNTDTNFTGNVTLSLYSNPTGATLSGTLTVAAAAGIASFTNLQIDTAGTYTLLAECND